MNKGYIVNVDIPFLKGEPGSTGSQGYSVASVSRTSGTGAPGTVDTYTMYNDASPSQAIGTFEVTNGTGGDMSKSVYDVNNAGIVDRATGDANGNEITTTYETISNVSAIDDRVEALENAGYITNTADDLVNYYTKTEIDTSGYITKSVSDLVNYYTKTEIDTMVGNIETLLASI
jgi:hypothetical protein